MRFASKPMQGKGLAALKGAAREVAHQHDPLHSFAATATVVTAKVRRSKYVNSFVKLKRGNGEHKLCSPLSSAGTLQHSHHHDEMAVSMMRVQQRRYAKAFGLLLLYMCGTYPALKFMFDFKDGDFSFVDGCYLAIVTMTTVGYGDITPDTSAQKSFFMVYVICGIVVVGDALGIVAQFVLEEQEKLRKAAQEKVANQLKASLEGAELEEKRPGMIKFILEHPLCICDDVVLAIWQKVRVSKQWAYFKLGIPVFIFLLLGLIMCELEDWSPHDGLYFSVITLLTIGYGDKYPESDEGKMFAMFYLPLGVITATNMLANMATLTLKLESKKADTEDTLKKLLDVLEHCAQESDEVYVSRYAWPARCLCRCVRDRADQ